jgi:hypothetical protein
VNEDILNRFLLAVAGNPKILPSHISLFSAILSFREGGINSFNVSRSKLMRLSKLSSTATYHKCIQDLIIFGFISYKPSFNPLLGSVISFH